MRIVQLVPSLVTGGAEVFAVTLAAALERLGHEVWLITLKPGDDLAGRLTPGLAARWVRLAKTSRYDARVLPRLVQVLRALRPDVVHAHLFTGLAWGTVAARAAGVGRVVYTEHECHPDALAWLPWVRRALSAGVDVVAGCSDAAAEKVLRDRHAPFSAVCTVENGIVVDGRPQATLDGTPLRVGTVGRLVAIKGQTYLVEAIRILRARGVDVAATVVGDGPLRAALQAQIDAAGIADRVRLVGASDDVAGWMARFDVFCLPSLSEALPMTLLEAGAAGLPMVVTTGGGGPTLLAAGAGGRAVPPGDAEALADAIGEVAAMSVAERRRLGAASREVVRSRYGIEVTAARYLDLYHR